MHVGTTPFHYSYNGFIPFKHYTPPTRGVQPLRFSLTQYQSRVIYAHNALMVSVSYWFTRRIFETERIRTGIVLYKRKSEPYCVFIDA
jgi:hypothetical protein